MYLRMWASCNLFFDESTCDIFLIEYPKLLFLFVNYVNQLCVGSMRLLHSFIISRYPIIFFICIRPHIILLFLCGYTYTYTKKGKIRFVDFPSLVCVYCIIKIWIEISQLDKQMVVESLP